MTPCPQRRTALPCLAPPTASGGVGRVRTRKYKHSRYLLRALLNRYLRPARPGARKLGRSVPEGPGLFVSPPNWARGFEGGGGRRHRPLPYQKGLERTRVNISSAFRSYGPMRSGAFLVSRDSRCVGVSTMSRPEGLDTVGTPIPLALGGVWLCSTPRW
eukprot:6188757-Pleurochrysis_carterae.AAC.2